MIQFLPINFHAAWIELEGQQDQARRWIKQYGQSCFFDRNQKNKLWNVLYTIERFCADLEMEKSLSHVHPLKVHAEGPIDLPASVVESSIRNIKQTICAELSKRKFAFIQTRHADYYEQDNLFGERVSRNFPSARQDIKDAGNCLAANLNTAVVYHLMRVMELGLRTLHKKLKKSPPSNPNWGNMLREIEKFINDSTKNNTWPVSLRKNRDFYIECATHFFFFKNKRNRSVHVEYPLNDYVPPDSDKALEIFREVKSFMEHLATKLKEP